MPLAKHNYHTAAAIPSHISPEEIIDALHDHNTCLTLQAPAKGHEKLPETDTETLNDTFWYPTDKHPPTTYCVTEVIQYLPWFSRSKYDLTFPSVFQDTQEGLKTRADASGVVLRAEYRVIAGSTIEGVVEGEGEGLGQVEWVLVEDVEVVCTWWMMPLVRGKMEEAHRDICRKVVEKVVMANEQVAALRAAGQGKLRVEVPLENFLIGESVDSPVQVHSPDKMTYA